MAVRRVPSRSTHVAAYALRRGYRGDGRSLGPQDRGPKEAAISLWDAARAASSSDNPPSGPTSAIFHIGMSAKTSERPMDAPSSASIPKEEGRSSARLKSVISISGSTVLPHCLTRLDRRLLRRASGLSFLYNRHRPGRLEKDNRGYTKLSRLLYDKLGLVP